MFEPTMIVGLGFGMGSRMRLVVLWSEPKEFERAHHHGGQWAQTSLGASCIHEGLEPRCLMLSWLPTR